MNNSFVTAKTIVLEDEMKYNGVTLLKYKIEYPEFKSTVYRLALNVINKFYKAKALEYQSYCKSTLFKDAVKQYKYDSENNFPIHVFEAMSVFKMTYNKACVISLYTDKYEYTGGAHGSTKRTSQTWNLQSISRLGLSQLFVCPSDYKEYILKQVSAQIKKDPSIYFDNYEKLIREAFNEDSFYCTPTGVTVYYQQYDIAPYSSGIREFLIPYSLRLIDPAKKCFRLPTNL